MRKVCKLKEVCHIEKGKQIDTSLLSDKYSYRYINGGVKESGYYKDYNVSGEAVLVSEGGASCGYVNYINEKIWCGCHCYSLTDFKVPAKYLFYALKANQEKLMQLRTGAAMPNIKKTTFVELPLSIDFDSKTQFDIINSLDAISTSIEIKKTQLDVLDNLVKSRFIEMFNSGCCETVSFGDVCEFLRNGANIKQTKGLGGIPITRIETISNDMFNINRLGYAGVLDLGKYSQYQLKEGDILISHINSVAYLGRAVAYRNEVNGPVIHGMNLLCARLNNRALSEYIEFYFKTIEAKAYISSITKRAVNQASITASDLKKMPVLLPSIVKQQDFAEFVKLIDKSKFIVREQIKNLQELLDSKMDEYFG